MKWMARAIATDWRWPPDSDFTGSLKRRKLGLSRPITLRHSRFHGDVVERAPLGPKLAAEIEIGGGVDIVGERQRLVDRLDAERLGIARIVDLGQLAIDVDVAGIALVGARQDLDQRRLAGAVVAEQAHHLAREEIDRWRDRRP